MQDNLNFKQILPRITTLMFDVDGVLTDGKVIVTESGELMRNMHSKDGYAIHLAITKGYRIVIVSGGNNVAVKNALNKAGVADIFINQRNKLQCLRDFMKEKLLKREEVLYMGDDLPDYHVMQAVGLAVCPKDAAPEIKQICKYISDRNGGEGCVRDIIEQVMRSQNKWEIADW